MNKKNKDVKKKICFFEFIDNSNREMYSKGTCKEA
jgi:hypothetical protein